jgi:hypothetical protein
MATFYTLKSFTGANNNKVELCAVKSRKKELLGFSIEYTQDDIVYTEKRTKCVETAKASFEDVIAAINTGWTV